MGAMFKSGKTLREIGAAHGVSYVTARAHLLAHGYRMKPKGRKPALCKEKLVEALAVNSGNRKAAAAALGVSIATVQRAIQAL